LAKLAILVIGAAAAKIAKSMSFEGGQHFFRVRNVAILPIIAIANAYFCHYIS